MPNLFRHPEGRADMHGEYFSREVLKQVQHDNKKMNKPNDTIFLIGFMGCGKTTLGRKLASRLDYDFMDLDHVLEAQVGMTIADYFTHHGEESFRKLESEVLKQTAYPTKVVVSTGGGLPCFFDNMDWMNAHGKTIYIKLSPKTLADRLEREKTHRPLLREKHGETLIAFITDKLAERDKFYGQASIIADGLSLTAEKVVTMITAE